MDSITHTVLGACVGEVFGGKKLGKKAMLIGAIANNIPDIDVVTSFWMKQSDGLLAHRGFTHSILFALLITLALGWGMKKKFRSDNFSMREWWLLIGINIFLHLIIDSLTVYGTGWFEPFSHHRVSFNVLFVADPFFTISLLVASVSLLILKKKSGRRKIWVRSGLIISALYLVYALIHKFHVEQVVKKNLMMEKTDHLAFLTTPTPLNNFLWYIVEKRDSGYNVGYYSVFDHDENIRFHFVSKNDYLASKKENDDELKKLIRFSQGYYRLEKIKDTLVFNDLRFGQIGGWFKGDAPFVFQFALSGNADHEVIQRGRYKASGRKALQEMIKRIRGI